MVTIVTPFTHTHQTYRREPKHLSKLTQLFIGEALYKFNIWLFNLSDFFPSQNEINEKIQTLPAKKCDSSFQVTF